MEQTACDRCRAELVPGAAYCDNCGERTRRARRFVRLAVRIEVLAVLMTLAVVIAFALIYVVQR